MEPIILLLVQILGGATGGNAVAATSRNPQMTTLRSTIIGIIGGVITGQIAGSLGVFEPRGLGGIFGNVLSGGIGGAAAAAIVRVILKSNYEAKQKASNQPK